MEHQDLADLFAYKRDLPASEAPTGEHDLTFPKSVRRVVGLWKSLCMRDGFFLAVSENPSAQRGRYLVEALAHCAECHTPRDALGGLDRSRWMQGARDPAGAGRIPGLTPDQLDWPDGDLIVYFEIGLTPDYDKAFRPKPESLGFPHA
jgi:mono/diheme cytochrome c family protein